MARQTKQAYYGSLVLENSIINIPRLEKYLVTCPVCGWSKDITAKSAAEAQFKLLRNHHADNDCINTRLLAIPAWKVIGNANAW